MQTFLPYPDYRQSMRCLDPSRLGNQIYREGITILKGGWPNHPACKMWKGYQSSLCDYLLAGLDELQIRGLYYPTTRRLVELCKQIFHKPHCKPPWIGNESFHSAHRAALLFKDFSYYSKFGWTEKPEIKYVWPV